MKTIEIIANITTNDSFELVGTTKVNAAGRVQPSDCVTKEMAKSIQKMMKKWGHISGNLHEWDDNQKRYITFHWSMPAYAQV